MRTAVVVSCVAILTVSTACGGTSPLGPSLDTAPGGPAVAEIRISRVGLEPSSSSALTYAVHFRLTEVSGLSGALITSIELTPQGVTFVPVAFVTTSDCWGTVRLDAGGFSDAFAFFARPAAACAPTLRFGAPPYGFFDITITFVDDAGRTGRIRGRVAPDEEQNYLVVTHIPT